MKNTELRSLIREEVKKVLTEATMVSFADYYRAYGRDVKAAAVFLDQTIESAGIEVTEELFDAITDLIDEVRADIDVEESVIKEVEVTNANTIKQILKNSFRFKRTPRGGMLGIPLGNNNNDDIESNSIAMQGIANLVKQLKNTKEMNVVSVLQPGATDIEFTVKTDTAVYTVNLRAGSVRNSLVTNSQSFWMLLDSIKKSK